jgi:hypothetical protein
MHLIMCVHMHVYVHVYECVYVRLVPFVFITFYAPLFMKNVA